MRPSSSGAERIHRSDTSRALAIFLLEFVVVLIVSGLGLVDIAGLRQGLQLGLCVVIPVLALLALRIVVQVTMLHEEHDDGWSR